MREQIVKLHGGQYEVATHPARFKVICAGRRWGKSVLSRMIMLKWALETPGDYWIVTPTFIQGKDIHWIQGFKRELNENAVAKWNESDLSIVLRNGSRIQIKSAENPDRLVGVKLNGLIIDEIAKMRHWNWLWSEALRPTLTDHQAPALFISSPRGYNHFYDLFEMGQKDGQLYKSWHFTSYDNPYVPKNEIDQVKGEVPLEKFSQEYMAEFTRFTGLIYKEFDEETHVALLDHEYNQRGVYLLGLDFATRGYTAATVSYINDDGTHYVLDCYKKDNLTAKEHASAIRDMAELYAPMHKYQGYADPAGWADNQQGMRNNKPMRWSLADEYLELNFPITQGNNKVLGGINYIRQMFKDNKLIIHPRCQDLIDELHDYQWKEQPEKHKSEKSAPEEPRKFNDHLVDSLRYAMYSKSEAMEPEPEKPKYAEGDPLYFKPWWESEMTEEEKMGDKFTPTKNTV